MVCCNCLRFAVRFCGRIRMIADELKALSAPRKVVEAGVLLDEAFAACIRPSSELVAYVREWVTRNMGNNRYGT